jgi:acyl carrier protein
LNRPELTAEKFLELPWMPGERVYRTGDGARWLADGTIEFAGRLDHQVKIRGFRVELGEIQTALAQHPTVAESVVLARPDSSGNNRLLAYVVPKLGGTIDIAVLREHLQKQLPDYMVPAAITALEKFPLTANGKLDRRALPEPNFGEARTECTLPRTTTEEMLAEIWCDVLQVELVGIHDNFFELGGHSLLATQVITRVNDALGVDLSMRQFFLAPTIERMAAVLEEALIADIQAGTEPAASPGHDAELVTAKE